MRAQQALTEEGGQGKTVIRGHLCIVSNVQQPTPEPVYVQSRLPLPKPALFDID